MFAFSYGVGTIAVFLVVWNGYIDLELLSFLAPVKVLLENPAPILGTRENVLLL
jgi:hypothetical protein